MLLEINVPLSVIKNEEVCKEIRTSEDEEAIIKKDNNINMDFLMGHHIKSDKNNGHVHQKTSDNETKSIMHIGFHFNTKTNHNKHNDSNGTGNNTTNDSGNESNNNINSILKDFSNELNNKVNIDNKHSDSNTNFRLKQIHLHKIVKKQIKLGQSQTNKLAPQINIHVHGMCCFIIIFYLL